MDFLLLVQPIYMLQVYDRVLSSSSKETLLYITIIAVLALCLFGALETIRGIIAARISAKIGAKIGPLALQASMKEKGAAVGSTGPMRDLAKVRGFIGGKPVLSFMSLPFAPIFIAILYFIHPQIFVLTLFGALLLIAVALLNQKVTSKMNEGATQHAQKASMAAMAFVKGSETIRAMAMQKNIEEAWGNHEAKALTKSVENGSVNALFSGFSRFIRMTLQIAILGYGGYLVLQNDMTAGMIFAAAIISGRALQPIDQIIGTWQSTIEAKKAWERLTKSLANVIVQKNNMELPNPKGRITLEGLTVLSTDKNVDAPILDNLSLRIDAGQTIGIVGPSGAGKSTLVRALVGSVLPNSGKIRIDDTDLSVWNAVQLGENIGYLPQEVQLFPGSIAQNIARFHTNATSQEIIRAAEMAHIEPVINQLPEGFNTQVGPGGHELSGGQKQRIGLARAFFRMPALLILDEPNSNLDAEGDAALLHAVKMAKQHRTTVILVSHRMNVIDAVDQIMILVGGKIEQFGTREEIMARQQAKLNGQAIQPKTETKPREKTAQAKKKPAAKTKKPVTNSRRRNAKQN